MTSNGLQGVTTMNPIKPGSDLSVNTQYHLNQLAEAAEQRRLVLEATEGQPTRLGRLSASLSALKANIAQHIQDKATAATTVMPSEVLPQRTPLLGGKQSLEV